MSKHRLILSFAALTAAIAVGLLSFLQKQDITANLLILVAQFLLYSLTMAGLGEFVVAIVKLINPTTHDIDNPTLHTGGNDKNLH